jgi:hypothetical protein
MGWIRFDNGIGNHRKALELSEHLYLPALGLFLVSVAYCDQQRTDGFMPAKALPRISFGDYQLAADELVRVGLFETVQDGYQIHDYLDWQMSREQIEAQSKRQRDKALKRHHGPTDAAGIADSGAAGNADETRQDDTDEPRQSDPIKDETTSPEVELSRLSDARLSAVDTGDLIRDFDFELVKRAIETAQQNEAQGVPIKSFVKYVRGCCRNLQNEPDSPRLEKGTWA